MIVKIGREILGENVIIIINKGGEDTE